LHIDFAIHDAGPATDWALRARIGDALEIGGPRGSAVIPMEFDWYLLIGDETGLPAIGRRLEELPAGSRALVIVRRALIDELGANRAWVKAAGYWKRGAAAVHERIED
jgi:NADPH-dependent ferric siderophore reductase